MVKHSFVCEECSKYLDVMSDVTGHMLDHGQITFFKEFGNCIIRIGALHAEINMLHLYVSMT